MIIFIHDDRRVRGHQHDRGFLRGHHDLHQVVGWP
jgi:hypothetical protein